MATDTLPHAAGIIGAQVPRIDGPLKTSGTARYAVDHDFPGLLHAVPVQSTIASGRIRKLDASAAEKMPGVLLVFHHGNMDKVYRLFPHQDDATTSEARPPFEDEKIYYWGQYVAVVVAETLEQAKAAAGAVHVEYDADKPNVNPELSDFDGPRQSSWKRGDPDKALASAPVVLDETYTTPVETHNPMEMHGTVAVWDGDSVTLYECSQGVVNHRIVMAEVLGIPRENVRVISRFIGSGFGGKLFPWPQSTMAAAAARRLNRPVKLSVDRRMMFSNVGHRPHTEQHIRLGATTDGKLTAIRHDFLSQTSLNDEFMERCGEQTPFLYSCPNLEVTAGMVRRNVGAPAPMRGPGAVPGLFALESAMDELAIKLKMDPLELRLKERCRARRRQEPSVLFAPPEGVLHHGRGKDWLEAANSRTRVDAPQRKDYRVGPRRRIVGCGTNSLHRNCRAMSQRPCLRPLRHTGHWHRHLHHLCAGGSCKNRRAVGSYRRFPRRHIASGGADFRRLHGHQRGVACRYKRSQHCGQSTA